MSKPSSNWGPSSPGQELLCVSRRKFANLDLLRIRHFEKFIFRSDTHGTGNRAIRLVDFLYQPSQELSRVIMYRAVLYCTAILKSAFLILFDSQPLRLVLFFTDFTNAKQLVLPSC